MKTCKICNLEKPFGEFYRSSECKFGYASICKSCHKATKKPLTDKQKAALRAAYYKNHKARLEYNKKYKENNKHRIKGWPSHSLEYRQKWQEDNKESISEYQKLYREKNKERISEQHKEAHNRRRKIDPGFKIRANLRTRLSDCIKNKTKNGSFIKDLGCSIEFLKQHLESQFTEGMTWDNQGHGTDKWVIDHIMPLSAFNLEDRQHFLLACHYGNLQPLWFIDNAKKSNKIPEINGVV